jgi:hypothetical protein
MRFRAPWVGHTLPSNTMSGERLTFPLSTSRRQPLAQPAPKLARVSRGAPSDVGSETAGRRREVSRPFISSSGDGGPCDSLGFENEKVCWPDVTPRVLACSGGSPIQRRQRLAAAMSLRAACVAARQGKLFAWNPRNRQRHPRRRGLRARWPRLGQDRL